MLRMLDSQRSTIHRVTAETLKRRCGMALKVFYITIGIPKQIYVGERQPIIGRHYISYAESQL